MRSQQRSARPSSDGRRPVENGSEFDVSVTQIRASSTGSGPPAHRRAPLTQPVLEPEELTILTSCAEALAEAATFAPERIGAVPASAHAGAAWRTALEIAEPSPRLEQAINSIDEAMRTAIALPSTLGLEVLVSVVWDSQPGESAVGRLARRVLRSALEQRQTRQTPGHDPRPTPRRHRDDGAIGGPDGLQVDQA